jgi:predicted ATPase
MSPKDTQKSAAMPATDLLAALQSAGFGMMPGVGTDWMTTMSDMGREMLEFTAARMKQDMQMQQDLLQAKGLAEVQQIQAQFFQKAMQDYTNETARLMGIGKTLVGGSGKSGAVPL